MLHRNSLLVTFSVFILIGFGCNNHPEETETPPPAVVSTPLIPYTLIQSLPHDTNLFTEGLLMHNGKMYESTGSPDDMPATRSLVGARDLATGKFEMKAEIDRSKYFGEGIVFVKGKLFQLTYKNQLGFIYDEQTFKQLGTFSYRNLEGWGMTTDGTNMIMSDGTDTLTFLNPANQKVVKLLKVTENGLPFNRINELELIKGFIYANVWMTNNLVKIDTASGKIVGKIDLSSLEYEARNKNPNADVLNGIAYDSASDKIYVTGKLWPNIYQIQFAH